MFTGIIEHAGLVVAADLRAGEALALSIDLGPCAEGVRLGDSIAVRGCCLTVEGLSGSVAHFHLMRQTLDHTAFRATKAGARVNIERSLRLGDRLGGHLVSGHLDGLGEVTTVREGAGQWDLSVRLPVELLPWVIPKGSIALDGVSLTVARLEDPIVTVCIIPHTLAVTTLGTLAPGHPVHLEMDGIGKWVHRMIPPGLVRSFEAAPSD